MNILYTSDIHASDSHLYSMLSVAEKEDVDCVIIGGDIVPHNLPNEVKDGPVKAQAIYLKDVFIPTIMEFKQKKEVQFFLDLGNDDFFCNRSILEPYDGGILNLLHFKKTRLTEDVDIIGYMTVPPTPFTRKDLEKPDSKRQPYAPGNNIVRRGYRTQNGALKATVLDLASNDTIENDLIQLSALIERPFIFVSHSPPYNTPLDVLYNMVHAGSIAIRDFIAEWSIKGKLFASFHGHIHESPEKSGSISGNIRDCLCFNPGQDSGPGGRFRYVIFRLEGSRMLQKTDILKVGA